ncbi:flagellar hook-associated protein FlgL [Candidatus Contubernalis alkaliaceticus]|uniref:flagellar hook-associated protein FlgL n=1 Tax=Candidatus Contubernalis alkaliaceticus TaxID=338645 RepID=UPI001F4C2C8F|nr:flagellar hook-associated protein FlgL [Candidatus Contubernalis alkalaceticus]UNC91720.1 flagellar hook-associated protein FlgL [Candidatus Contubernalis alkalaceticus]
MRVTHQLVKNTVISNIQRNLSHMERYQNMLSSGKVLRRPSDDPIKVARVMSYRTTLSQNEQYQKNINAARSWMETGDYALEGVTEILHRAKELAITGANGSMPQSARDALAMEVVELANVLVQFGNSSYEGRYIFGGYKTTEVPFVREAGEAVEYKGNKADINWEVAPGVNIKGNIHGHELFFLEDGTETQSIFDIMDKLEQALKSSDNEAIDKAILDLSNATDHVLDKRASLGATVNGLELTLENYMSQKINFTELCSGLEDIDFAETIMNFTVMENIYRAAIASGAQIIQPSLLDFLR